MRPYAALPRSHFGSRLGLRCGDGQLLNLNLGNPPAVHLRHRVAPVFVDGALPALRDRAQEGQNEPGQGFISVARGSTIS